MNQPSEIRKILITAMGVLVLIMVSPVLLVGWICYKLWGFLLYVAIWIAWSLRGRDTLFVYSDSPIWRDYLEREIRPLLEQRAVLLNWSNRKPRKTSLAVLALRHFGGRRAFNPLVLMFRPFQRVRAFRFFDPFQEFKRGDPGKVEQMKSELLEALRATSSKQTA